MNRVLLAPLLAIACVGLLGAEDDPVTFKSEVSQVRVDVQVVDQTNRAITMLRAKDFVLTDAGRPQPIRAFSTEDMPVDVLLLLDVSASMRPHVETIGSSVEQALKVLGADDRVGIMVFDRSARIRLPFRNSPDAVRSEFESLLKSESFHGGTDITRALIDAAKYVQKNARKDARRAIVILTDDMTEYERADDTVLRVLSDADAVLSALIAPDAMQGGGYGGGHGGGRGGYPGGHGGGHGGGIPGIGIPGGGGGGWGGVIMGQPRPPIGGGGGRGPAMGGPHTRSAGTSEIARESGGDSMSVYDTSALENTLERIRQRYTLYFNVPAGAQAGEQRNITIRLADAAKRTYPDAEVRYRRNYRSTATVPADNTVVATTTPADTTVPAAQQDPEPPPPPTTVTRVPAPRRRVMLDDSGSHSGPNAAMKEEAKPTPEPAPAPAAASDAAPSPVPTATDSSKGWRTLDPATEAVPTPTPAPADPKSTKNKN
jgi:hypothetical protein